MHFCDQVRKTIKISLKYISYFFHSVCIVDCVKQKKNEKNQEKLIETLNQSNEVMNGQMEKKEELNTVLKQ